MIRLSRGLTQEVVAEKIGKTQNAYSKIETDNIKVSDEILDKLAKLFGVSAEDLKSPEPVIINFHNSPQSSSYNLGAINYTNEKLIQELMIQLKEKDKQIEFLLIQNKELLQLNKIMFERKD